MDCHLFLITQSKRFFVIVLNGIIVLHYIIVYSRLRAGLQFSARARTTQLESGSDFIHHIYGWRRVGKARGKSTLFIPFWEISPPFPSLGLIPLRSRASGRIYTLALISTNFLASKPPYPPPSKTPSFGGFKMAGFFIPANFFFIFLGGILGHFF